MADCAICTTLDPNTMRSTNSDVVYSDIALIYESYLCAYGKTNVIANLNKPAQFLIHQYNLDSSKVYFTKCMRGQNSYLRGTGDAPIPVIRLSEDGYQITSTELSSNNSGTLSGYYRQLVIVVF